ncbi:MAG: putative DNA binding domain-containing protein [Planctomycetota bacterium]|nr:putative DNA binding domain-containing protein [Planctomycetota bacterium]
MLSNLIALGEGFTTEFKRSGTSGIGREICAFANATGGVLMIGVSDHGEVVGVGNHNRLKSEVQATARSAEPPIGVQVESVGEVMCVTVPGQQSKPYSFGGKFFIREGASTQQMSRDEIREFFYKEGLIHFDETPCDKFSLESDLGEDVWALFRRRAKIPADMEPLTALRNLHLIGEDGRMTHAGAWLLARDIQKFNISADVACALFMGTDKVRILDRRGFNRDVYSMIDEVVAWILSKINVEYIIKHVKREERPELPEEALRETVVNALAHRDYRSTANVQVYLFKDRIEIVSPGGLPAGMTEADLGIKSVPRNPLLFGMLHRMDAVEHIGSGIRRIRELCRDYGVAEPEIKVSDSWVTTTFRRPTEQVEDEETAQVTAHGEDDDKAKFDNMLRALSRELNSLAGQVTGQVTGQVAAQVLLFCREARASREIQDLLELKHRETFLKNYLRPLLKMGWIEMTIPDKPTSSKQKYRITAEGKALLDRINGGQE